MKNKTTLIVALIVATVMLSGCYAGQNVPQCPAYQSIEIAE